MNLFTSVIVFLMIFWTVLFAVLPWGNRAPDTPEQGMAGSAPTNPRIKQKFVIPFGISVLLWIIVAILVELQIIDFYEISRTMIEEDKS